MNDYERIVEFGKYHSKYKQSLNDIERIIISERFWTDTPKTLFELAKQLNKTAEEVRQIEVWAVYKNKQYKIGE